MPKVKIFTAKQNRKRDQIAKTLIKEGYSVSRSYQISTANVKRNRRKK